MGKPNFASNTVWTNDNLLIMRNMNNECVDLIYLDPPFKPNANYAAPIGKPPQKDLFKEVWALSDIDIAWMHLISSKHKNLHNIIESSFTNSNKSYLCYMAVRILEMKRILKPSGSIYLHCDPTMSHWLKIMMDSIFGVKNFRSEVIWSHKGSWSEPKYNYKKKHNSLLFYSKSGSYTFNLTYEDDREFQTDYKRWKRYLKDYKIYGENMPSQDSRFSPHIKRFKKKFGRNPKKGDVVYECTGSRVGTVSYEKAVDPKSQESCGLRTQKPLALLRKIIQTSSNENDFVFDPFCGCATALLAANELKRKWAGIDISPKAVELIDIRMKKEFPTLPKLRKIVRVAAPQRTDLGRLPRYNSPNNKSKLYGEQGGYCVCGTHFEPQHFHVDHIIAKKSGGTDHIDNLQLLCGNCNAIKGNRGMEYLLAKLKETKGANWIKGNTFIKHMLQKKRL